MGKHYYKNIKDVIDLKTLDAAAEIAGKQAVGITNAGSLYKWDRTNRKAETIGISEAALILDLREDVVKKFVEVRGNYVIEAPVQAAPVVEVKEVSVETKENEKLKEQLESIDNKLDEILKEIRANGAASNSINSIENKVDKLAEDLEAFKNSILLD